MCDSVRLGRALDAIDAANADDPQRIRVRGEERPKERAHAELMSEWVARLIPEPSDAVLLAARAHHLRRWEIPRSDYPEGRVGYLRWRTDLHGHHAKLAGEILAGQGYGEETVLRVQHIIRKKGLGRDAEVQAFEDALCLVFLETQLAEFSGRVDTAKLENVARKTLRKMSERAIELAMALPLPDDARSLLARVRAEQ